jgi:hypothetical protein
MKKISTKDLIARGLESYLDDVLSCFDFNDYNLDQHVTGRARELLEKLPESERTSAISRAISRPDYGCINCFPFPQKDYEFFLPPMALEIDITNIALEEPEDFYIQKFGDRKLAYYYMDYGAFIDLDLDKLEKYITEYLNI